MVNLTYIVFICVAIPFLLSIPLMTREMRPIMIYILIGMFACLFVSEVNGIIRNLLDADMYYITTNITPVTEELVKAVPVFIYAFFVTRDKHKLIPVAFACGVGFSLLENTAILVDTVFESGEISILWALIRTFGAGLLHGMCTAIVAIGLTFMKTARKFAIPGTIALMEFAILYHSIFNSLIQSDYRYLGASIPMITYLIMLSLKAIELKKPFDKI